MLAFGFPESIEVVGVSTVYGNQTIEKTTCNAAKILAICQAKHVPLIQGSGRPLLAQPMICPEIHGESGLELHSNSQPDASKDAFSISSKFSALPVAPLAASPDDWLPAMAALIRAHPNPVHLCCTGPLTNAALLLRAFPGVAERLAQVVLLGGACGLGNMTPSAEFNILNDPEAAHVVFHLNHPRVPVVQIPIEVTHTALVTPDVLSRVLALDSSFARLAVDLLRFFGATYLSLFGMEHPPLHDPLAVAYIINPAIFTAKPTAVDVSLTSTGPSLKGRTIVDVYNMQPASVPRNVVFASKVDVDAFWDMMLQALQKINEITPFNHL